MLGGTLLNFRIIFRPVSLLFCTLLCCSTGIVSAQTGNPDGSRGKPFLLPLNTPVTERINASRDVDYFRIDPSTRTFVSIFTTGDRNTAGKLINSMSNVLQTDDESGIGDNFRIGAPLEMEPYFIAVNLSDFGNFGEYDIHANEVTVTEIELNTSVSGTVDFDGDADYFSIVISTPTFVNIFTTGELTTAGKLINSMGTESASDDATSGSGSNFRILTRLDPMTYYIQVNFPFEDTGEYDLHVDEFTATEIELDTSVSETIDPEDDVDYFSIEIIDTPTDINIFTTGKLDTIGRLINSVGTELARSSEIDSGNLNFLISTRLDDRETYYIEVGGFESSTGKYTLYVLTDDHSPTTNRATVLSLNAPESGRIDPANNVDYFSIEINTQTDVNIFTTGKLNTAGELINSGGKVLQTDDGSGSGGNNFLITANLEQGIYYIGVRSSTPSDISLTGDYMLQVNIDATPVPLNTSVSDTIDPENDLDYFSIVISTPTFVAIYTTGGLNTAGSLQDNTGNVLQTDDQSGSGNNFLIRAPRLERGTYYIQVSALFGDAGEYDLHVDEVTVTEIELNTSVSGTIERENNLDYFSLEIDTPTYANIFTTDTLNTIGTLIDSAGNALQTDDQSGEKNNFLIRARLDPVTYYIEVRSSGTETGNYDLHVDEVVPRISLIIPSTLIESTNEIIGSTMRDVKHGEPFPVYISVAIATTFNSLLLTLDGPQDGALPPTLMTSALGAGATWSEFFVGNSTTAALGQQNYRYCLAGTQNCSPSISVSYSPPDDPIVDVEEIGSEWDFTLSEQTATPARCPSNAEVTLPTLLRQEGNAFTSESFLIYTGIVDGDSYSLAYRDPNVNEGTYIDTHVTQYSRDPVALSGPGVWWWTNRAGFLCRGTYNIVYTPRPHIDSIAVARMSVSEDVGAVTVTVTLTHPPVQSVAATLEIKGTATDADYQVVERNISFDIGERQTTLNLVIVDDKLDEPDETIILEAVPQDLNTLVGTTSTTLTIEDNDVLTINFERASYVISEGATGTVTLLADQSAGVKTQIRLTTLSGTVSDDAYQLSPTIVVFEPSQSTASFEVSIFDDNVVRSTRKLSLSFNPINNSTRGTVFETVISIKDNDIPNASLEVVGIVGNNILLEEGADVMLRVTLDRSFEEATTIQIVTTGTATLGEDKDYTITDNPVELSTGNTSVETQLTIRVDDDDDEPDETIILTLTASNNLIIVDRPEAKLTLTIGRADLLFRMKVFLEGAQ